ncbi:efflux RND transporter periplasmic adaptor subunit [Halocola ammonii]
MRTSIINRSTLFSLFTAAVLFSACSDNQHNHDDHNHEADNAAQEHHSENVVHLTAAQFQDLGMKVGKMEMRDLKSSVMANGRLEVPPQNEATVTAILGGNVYDIQVIEGDDVSKGQTLAYLSHPSLTELQSTYLKAYNNLQFLKKDFERKKKLYESEVGSGKEFQQAESEYLTAQSTVKSHEAQLRQLGLNPDRIREGEFYQKLPIKSPINGSITMVEVKTGQYVSPDTPLFEIVNVEHIHADLMVFEKDVAKVEKGQEITFTVESLPGQELSAVIYAVGKKFEQDPKAIHIHAEINNKTGNLIPGMYIQGEIHVDSQNFAALPEQAIVSEGSHFMAFMAQQGTPEDPEEWEFTAVELTPKKSYKGWTAVEFSEKIPEEANFALNNAYYLQAEKDKEGAEHSH